MKLLRTIGLSIGIAGLLIAAFAALQTPKAVQALPPRPEPMTNNETPTPAKGGFIVLTVDGAASDVWTTIQWQDDDGDWHLVDGWQGHTNAENEVKWYVAKDNLGSGPFRWLVYDESCGSLLARSDPFDLPGQSRQTVRVDVALP